MVEPKTCPFCESEMTIYKDRFYHANNAEDRCIIGAVGWPIEKAELWNARTLPTDQDKRDYDALIEKVARAIHDARFGYEYQRSEIDEMSLKLARAAIDAYESTLLKERDALRGIGERLLAFAARSKHPIDCGVHSSLGICDCGRTALFEEARAALSTTRAMK